MVGDGTILVTGAAGFIGSHLTERLLADGRRVVGLENFDDFYDPAVKRNNLRSASQNGNFTLVEGDIRDRATLDGLLREARPDAVVHLAARAGVRPSIQNPALYVDVNVHGTQNVLDAMRDAGIGKLVFASSSSVYGCNEKVPFSETDPVDNPISPYAATKKAGELLCYTYNHLFDMDVSCVRFFTVYGPRQRPEMAIHKFARMIAAGEPIPLFGDGKSSRDYTYVTDIIDGLMAILEHTDGYEIYNLGDSNPVELERLVGLLETALGAAAHIDRQPMQPGDVPTTFADIAKATAAVGYQPRIEIEEGIRRFAEWFQANAK